MNIIAVFQQFPTQQSCIEHLERARWPKGPRCPYCASDRTARLQHRHRCYACKTSFSVTVGTIFHHTHMPLQKWFLAVTLILNAKKGLSALQLSRDLRVNKNTAWRINMQIRKAMRQSAQRDLLTGIVEMDETYVGGKPRRGGPPATRGRGTDKVPVVGAVERQGRVTAKVTRKGKLKGRHLRSFIRDRINIKRSVLMTDEYKGYLGVEKLLPHAVIKHARTYVEGIKHTNTIEGFWALLKRGLVGQFHSVTPRHLQRYVDEFCFRYNLRHFEQDDMFTYTIYRCLGVSNERRWVFT